jgi:adenylate cyclase
LSPCPIEKFAGDALLALFGAPVAHEDDAERALLSALEMHRELARLVQDLPHDAELTLHVGVNSGHGIGHPR